ncbi:MAG: hypothetical protein GF317_19630 [Candidatus Lokiarchaeota archaeon]|nr:hypothetical protein [Candidatus Lokiarchaeota archaeon]MBD3201708.1 hypothetical protein [Candidatus Lokiarchaeota archaeon]
MSYHIGFDIGHKPRGRLGENYKELKELLENNDFQCHEYYETSITQESLKSYDILVFACPDFAKISRQEILELENWVKDDGGGLLLLSHAGGDKGRNSNLSDLSEIFGITFENDQVLDEVKNLGLENLPIISNFTPPHPITNGIDKLCYRAGCSVSIIGAAIPIAISNDSSDPFSTPLICVSEPEKGRVCCSGSYEMFRDRIGGGLKFETHKNLALNMFQWLVSEYRMDLRSSNKYQPPTEETDNLGQSSSFEQTLKECVPPEVKYDDTEILMKISNKSELMNLLKTFLSQINTMKGTIEKLIDVTSMSEDDIIDLSSKEADVKSEAKQKDLEKNQEELEALFSEKAQETKDIEEVKDEEETSEEKEEIVEKESEEEEEDDLEQEVSKDEEIEEEFEGDIQERREELQAEVKSLESKLKSVLNLVDFVEKNYDAGKMDKGTYNKQSKKLAKEVEQIKRRIEKLTDLLK